VTVGDHGLGTKVGTQLFIEAETYSDPLSTESNSSSEASIVDSSFLQNPWTSRMDANQPGFYDGEAL